MTAVQENTCKWTKHQQIKGTSSICQHARSSEETICKYSQLKWTQKGAAATSMKCTVKLATHCQKAWLNTTWTCLLRRVLCFIYLRIGEENGADQWSRLNRRNRWKQQAGRGRFIREIQQYSRKDGLIVGEKKVNTGSLIQFEFPFLFWRVAGMSYKTTENYNHSNLCM